MTILTPLIAQALGRSPYDDEVWQLAGMPTPGETTDSYQQQYDQRGRPVNPTSRRINRDIIRAHNEVMLAIGVVEPETSWHEALAKQDSIRRHRHAEITVANRLLFVNRVIEKCVVWGVNGFRQRIMIYKDYAKCHFFWPFEAQGGGLSLKSYLLPGFPAYIVSHLPDYFRLPNCFDKTVVEHVVTYLRLHLEIFSFLQRMGLGPPDTFLYLPTWRFFVPGTSISPIPVPPLPSSFSPRSLLGWLSTFAVGLAPFAGYYLFKQFSAHISDLKFKFLEFVPAPTNRRKKHVSRSPLRDVTSRYYPDGTEPDPFTTAGENNEEQQRLPSRDADGRLIDNLENAAAIIADVDDDLPGVADVDDAAAFPVGTVRRQSAGGGPGAGGGSADEFASDEEENEMVRAAIISIEVGPADTNPSGDNNDVLGEIRPHSVDGNNNRADNKQPRDPVYRENTFTLMPSFFAASILGLTTFRILATPWEGFVLSALARSYARRRGLFITGAALNSISWAGQFSPWTRWINYAWLEAILFTEVAAASLSLTLVLFDSKISDEEWEEMEKSRRLDDARMAAGDEEGQDGA